MVVLATSFVCTLARYHKQKRREKDLETGSSRSAVAERPDMDQMHGTVRSAISAASGTFRSVLSIPDQLAMNPEQASRVEGEGLNELGEAPPPYAAAKSEICTVPRRRGHSTRESGHDDRWERLNMAEPLRGTGGTGDLGVGVPSRPVPVVSGPAVVCGVSIPVPFA